MGKAFDEYREATEAVEKARTRASAVARKAFRDEVALLFKKHPKLEWFSWSQYTPYFMDGDVCVFSVSTDNGQLCEGDEERDWENSVHDDLGSEIAQLLGAFAEPDYLAMFGDHATVTVSRDGITTSVCNHD